MGKRTQEPARPRKLSREQLAPLLDCPCHSARVAARRLTQFYDARLAKTGVTIAQFGLLAQIAGADDDSLGALADRASLDPSTLTRNLQALTRGGLVEIVVAESDLRKRAVLLTKKGLRTLTAALPVWTRAQTEALEVVDAPALRAIARSTRKLSV